MNEPKTVEECRAIVLAEYAYWRDSEYRHSENLTEIERERIVSIELGATAAAANIFAALHGLVPVRPKQPTTP